MCLKCVSALPSSLITCQSAHKIICGSLVPLPQVAAMQTVILQRSKSSASRQLRGGTAHAGVMPHPQVVPLGFVKYNNPSIDSEQNANYVHSLYHDEGRDIMVRAVAEEALALASIALFLGMVAVWVQVLGVV